MAKERKSTKRALVASGISILLCVLMLIGTTLAWFTDQASNKNNLIQSGTLELLVIGYDDQGGNPINFKTQNIPLISEDNWEPDKTETKYIMVKNQGSLDLKFDLFFTGEDTKLAEALWYSFVEVTGPIPDGAPPTEAQKKAMAGFFSDTATNLTVNPLAAGDTKYYRLDYGMNPCAGNEYQGLEFKADIHVVATQTNPNAVIGGNIIPVFTAQDLLDAIAEINAGTVTCPTIILMDNIYWPGNMNFIKPFNLDLNGYTLTVDGNLTFDIDQSRGTMDFGDKNDSLGKILLSGVFIKTIASSTFFFNDNADLSENQDISIVAPGGDLQGKIHAATAGSVVIVLPGPHVLPSTTTVAGGVTILGMPGSEITVANPFGSSVDSPVLLLGGPDITIDGITLDCASDRNLKGIRASSGTRKSGIVITNNKIANAMTAAVYLQDCDSPIISGNELTGVRDKGIYVETYKGTTADPVTITGNTISGTGTVNGGIQIDNGEGDVIISGNTITGLATSPLFSPSSSDAKACAIDVYNITKGGVIIVEDNIIKDCDRGISVYKFVAATAADKVIVRNNTIVNCAIFDTCASTCGGNAAVTTVIEFSNSGLLSKFRPEYDYWWPTYPHTSLLSISFNGTVVVTK